MPVVSITLEDTNRTILTDVYYKIISDIVDTTGIPYNTLVVLHKESEVTLTDNHPNITNPLQANIPTTVAKRRILATITEEYNEDALTTTAVHQQSAYPIFKDDSINVSIFPIYIKSDISIEFSYISPSKSEATRLRDDIRLRLSQTRNITLHDVEYNILLPEVIEEFILDVHTLKSRLYPTAIDDYFKQNSTKRMHLMTDMANTSNSKLAVRERQIRVVGLFDFNSMPEKLESDNENGNYRLTFIYKLSLDVPRAIGMRYPVMICNKVMPNKYVQFIEDNKLRSKEESNRNIGYSFDLYGLSIFEAHRLLENKNICSYPLNVPLFDEFNVNSVHKGYAIVATFLTDINEVDHKSLFNLNNIGQFKIPAPLLAFIQNSELQYITSPYSSFLYLGLHQEGRHFNNDILELDSSLNIKSKVELDLRLPVRVALNFILDISSLNNNAIIRLLSNTEILQIFLNEYIDIYHSFKHEYSGDIFSDDIFYRTLSNILYHFFLKEEKITLGLILAIVKRDNYIYPILVTVIRNTRQDMYKYLLSNNFIFKTDGYRTQIGRGVQSISVITSTTNNY